MMRRRAGDGGGAVDWQGWSDMHVLEWMIGMG